MPSPQIYLAVFFIIGAGQAQGPAWVTLAGSHETRKHDRDTDALTLCTRCWERYCVRIKTFRSEQSGKTAGGCRGFGGVASLLFRAFSTVRMHYWRGVRAPGRACLWAQSRGGGQGCPHNDFPGATSRPLCSIVSLSPPGCGLLREANLCTPRVGGGC